MPNIVSQLNIFVDNDSTLRVRGKFKDCTTHTRQFPILLPREGELVKLIINDCHVNMMHAGLYSVLTLMKKQFYIAKIFITVKQILKQCIHCRKQNTTTVKINQSYYRDFRENPTSTPYSNIFLDYFGPYLVKQGNEKVKVWVLCITCLWSRSINLKVCLDLSVVEFLRTFQINVYEYGMPEKVFSDLGTQLVAGANFIMDYLKDARTQIYLQENNVQTPSFQQYYKGMKDLGALVETCQNVSKLQKKLCMGQWGRMYSQSFNLNLLVAQAVNIINKRPVAYKEYARSDNNTPEVPIPITPELLTKGSNLPTLCVIPNSPPEEGDKWTDTVDPIDRIKKKFQRLTQC